METFVDIAIWGAIILVVIAALSAIILPLINAFGHPKSLIQGAIGVAFVVVVFLIGWAVSGDEVTTKYITNDITTAGGSKLVGGALSTMYILFVLAVVGIVVTEFKKAFR